jgi:hypothetical protein
MKPLSADDQEVAGDGSGKIIDRFNANHLTKIYDTIETHMLSWTDGTRQGCAGQYTSCFRDGGGRILNKNVVIHATATDGNCLATYDVTFGRSPFRFLKTMPCKTKLELYCVGDVKFHVETVKY